MKKALLVGHKIQWGQCAVNVLIYQTSGKNKEWASFVAQQTQSTSCRERPTHWARMLLDHKCKLKRHIIFRTDIFSIFKLVICPVEVVLGGWFGVLVGVNKVSRCHLGSICNKNQLLKKVYLYISRYTYYMLILRFSSNKITIMKALMVKLWKSIEMKMSTKEHRVGTEASHVFVFPLPSLMSLLHSLSMKGASDKSRPAFYYISCQYLAHNQVYCGSIQVPFFSISPWDWRALKLISGSTSHRHPATPDPPPPPQHPPFPSHILPTVLMADQ